MGLGLSVKIVQYGYSGWLVSILSTLLIGH